MLPAIREISEDCFTFPRDNVPAHCARQTVEMLGKKTTHCISPASWPPNSADLSHVDYDIWSVLQRQSIYTHRRLFVGNAAKLTTTLLFVHCWTATSRLAACTCVCKDGHFEQNLWSETIWVIAGKRPARFTSAVVLRTRALWLMALNSNRTDISCQHVLKFWDFVQNKYHLLLANDIKYIEGCRSYYSILHVLIFRDMVRDGRSVFTNMQENKLIFIKSLLKTEI